MGGVGEVALRQAAGVGQYEPSRPHGNSRLPAKGVRLNQRLETQGVGQAEPADQTSQLLHQALRARHHTRRSRLSVQARAGARDEGPILAQGELVGTYQKRKERGAAAPRGRNLACDSASELAHRRRYEIPRMLQLLAAHEGAHSNEHILLYRVVLVLHHLRRLPGANQQRFCRAWLSRRLTAFVSERAQFTHANCRPPLLTTFALAHPT